MNVVTFYLIRRLKTELEAHYITLPEFYMNLIKLEEKRIHRII